MTYKKCFLVSTCFTYTNFWVKIGIRKMALWAVNRISGLVLILLPHNANIILMQWGCSRLEA